MTMIQTIRLPLTVITWLWFVGVCGLFGGYAFWLSQKAETSQNSELQYLRSENVDLSEQNRQLEEDLEALRNTCRAPQLANQGDAAIIAGPDNLNQRSFMYTVKKGDTIWDIAALYGVDVKALMRWNNLGPRSPIFPGDQLIIVLAE